jgi:hypothetical protein
MPNMWEVSMGGSHKSIIVRIHKRVTKLTVIIIVWCHCYEFHKILSNILLSRLSQGGFWRNKSTIDNIFCSSDTEKKLEYNETVHQLFIDFKKAYDSVRREVLYNILTEFGVPTKLVRLIKMCLNGTYIEVCIGKHLTFRRKVRRDWILVMFATIRSRTLCLLVCYWKTKKLWYARP